MPRIHPGVPGKALFGLLSAAAIVLVLVLTLPFLVERLILPPLLDRTQFADQRLMVSRFGINGCTVHIAGRPGGEPLLLSGNVRLEWTLSGLWQRRIDGITLDGLLLDPGRLSGRRNSSQFSPDASRPSLERKGLPLVIEQVRIVNSFFILPGDQGRNVIPVSLSAHRQDPQDSADRDVLQYRIMLAAAGQEMKADCAYDHRKGSFVGRFEGAVNLASLAAALPFDFLSQGPMTGTADVAVRCTAGNAPFVLDRIEGEVRLRDFHWRSPRMPLEITAREGAGITFTGGGAVYGIHVAGLDVAAPVHAGLAAEADIFFTEDRIGWQGDLVVSPVVGQQVGRFVIDEAAPLLLAYEGSISGGSVKGKLKAAVEADQLQGCAVRYKEGQFRAAGLEAEMNFESGPTGARDTLRAELSLTGSDIAGELPGGVLVLPGVAIRASIQPARENEGNGLDMQGRLSVADGRLDLAAPDMHLQGIHLSLPFFLSDRQAGEVGEVRIDDIFLRRFRVGGLTGTVQQHRLEYLLSGELRTPVLPENPVRLAVKARMPQDEVPFIELSASVEQAGFDVARLAPLPSGLKKSSGTGMLDLEGSLAVDRCGVNGGLTVNLRDGNFDIPEAGITMHDAALTLHLPALPRLESAPAQTLTFGMLGGKNVVMHDVLIAFQVESAESLFIERMSARWGGGRIFTGGFRLRPDMKEIEVALVCDRLELAQILSQLGLAEAEGEGRMSGRIPLLYSDRAIFVDDGFLFTTPGEKGSLRIRQSDYLATGMPADVPQFSPLHFASAALGNFEYNWAKLTVDSEEENLLLMLQIDGRPKERLPYRFDAGRNLFVRLREGEAGGIDQPLKLDVNFRVPVNELFRHQSQIMRYFLQDK